MVYSGDNVMPKQLIALVLAAAFGIAHAADAGKGPTPKPGTPDAAVGNVPETTQSVGTNAPDRTDKKVQKKSHKKAKKTESTGDQNRADPATPATPAEPARK
jgi:hypothetical protein